MRAEEVNNDSEISLWTQSMDRQTNVLERWFRISSTLLKNDSWATVVKALQSLPEDVVQIYSTLEDQYPIKFDATKRKLYYRAFFKSASGLGVLYPSQVEVLILSMPALKIDSILLRSLIADKLQRPGSSYRRNTKNNGVFDFELFASLICEIQLRSSSKFVKAAIEQANSRKPMFPLNPDSSAKTIWDLFCMLLLLYCSFEVPYTLAFDSGLGCDSNSPLQVTDLVVNITFMMDIAISFVSSFEKGGVMIRDFRAIATNYLRTWFCPDLAGSFPFDSVLCLFRNGSVQGTNLIRFLRFTRALRLVRAVKFLAKLNSLHHHEAFEGLGWAFGVVRASFFLCIAAHTLGCLFTAVATDEDASVNWMTYYSHWSPDTADNWTRSAPTIHCTVVISV